MRISGLALIFLALYHLIWQNLVIGVDHLDADLRVGDAAGGEVEAIGAAGDEGVGEGRRGHRRRAHREGEGDGSAIAFATRGDHHRDLPSGGGGDAVDIDERFPLGGYPGVGSDRGDGRAQEQRIVRVR